MSVDVRTRLDADIEILDPARFFGAQLPEALEAADALLFEAQGVLRLPPLVVEVDGDSWTLRGDDAGIVVRPGASAEDGALVLKLDASQLTDLVTDQVTPMGWFSSGALALSGRLERLLDWWLVLRAALDGVAPHVAGEMSFDDGEGAPLHLTRRFDWDDADKDMTSSSAKPGSCTSPGCSAPRRWRPSPPTWTGPPPPLTPGDGRSWWARTGDGVDRLVRMQGFDTMSDTAAALVSDGRLARLGALTGDGHQWGGMESNALEALVQADRRGGGISDVPWHKDCSLGAATAKSAVP